MYIHAGVYIYIYIYTYVCICIYYMYSWLLAHPIFVFTGSSYTPCIFCESGQKTVSALRYDIRIQQERKQQPITRWIGLYIFPSKPPNINLS